MADNQMMMPPGLLAQYGLTDLSLSEYEQRKRQAIAEQAAAQAAASQGTDEPGYFNRMRQLGARIGGGITAPGASESEQARIEAVQAAQLRMKNAGLPISTDQKVEGGENTALQFQTMVAEELMNRGEYSVGTQMLAEAQSRARAIQLQQEALKQAGLKTKTDKSLSVQEQIKAAQAANDIKPTWTKDGQYADLRHDPETGYAIDDANNRYYAPGDFTTDENVAKYWASGEKASDLTDFQKAKLYQSPDAINFRSKRDEMWDQMASMNGLKDLLEKDAALHDGKLTIIGEGGKSVGWVEGAIDYLGQLEAAAFGGNDTPVTINNEVVELGSLQAAQDYLKKNPELKNIISSAAEQALGKDFAQSASLVGEWQAEIIRLAYAQARSNEPSNRGLSNQDFENALRSIAGNLSSPEALRKVLVKNLQRNFVRWNNGWKDLESVGLTEVYLGTKRYNEFRSVYDTFIEEWSNLKWGYTPSQGLYADSPAPAATVTPPPQGSQYRSKSGNHYSIVIPGAD